MIKLNSIEMKWEQGLTLEKLTEIAKQSPELYGIKSFFNLAVINGIVIEPVEHPQKIIKEGDDIKLISLLSGG